MLCNAVVYEGSEPYLFVSCAVQDAAVVGPILDQLGYDGYRIWFDEDCDAKNAVTSMMIEKVRCCSVFLVLVTNGYAASHVCRTTLNTAIESGKAVRVLVLQDVLLPQSLQMQLMRCGCSVKFEAITHALLVKKLYADTAIQNCYAAGRSFYARKKKSIFDLVKASRAAESAEKDVSKAEPEERPKVVTEEKPKIIREETAKVEQEEKPNAAAKETPKESREEAQKTIPESVKKDEEELPKDEETVFEKEDNDETVLYAPDDNEDGDSDDEQTSLIDSQEISGILFRLADETAYRITEPLIQLGRSSRKADIVLNGNTYIGNHHADIVHYRGNFYLRTVKASNGTFMDGERIEDGEQRRLDDVARFQFADEEFLFVSGTPEKELRKRGNFVLLKNTSTQELYILAGNELFLDRNHVWPGGTLDDNTISHKHARLYLEENEWILADLGSKNGTSVNRGNKLRTGETETVRDGASIRLGSTVLQMRILELDTMLQNGEKKAAEA